MAFAPGIPMGRTPSTVEEPRPLCVLLVEDDDACADFVIDAFAESPELVTVTRVQRLQEGLQQLATIPVDVVLLDLTLPDAFDLLGVNVIRAAAPDVALVVLTGSLDGALCARVIAAGADDYLQKDQVDTNLLNRSIWYARDRRACLDDAGVSSGKPSRPRTPATGGIEELDAPPNIEAMMAAVAAVALPTFAAWCVIQIDDADDDGVTHHAHAGVRPTHPVNTEDIAAVVRTGQPSRVGGKTLIVPLRVRARATGSLQLGRSETASPFSEDDRELAVELARRAALTFESARLYRMARATLAHRDVFLSITSQELLKPLTKLQISIDRMQRTARRMLPKTQPATESALRLARFISTLDGVAAGKLVIEPCEMDLAELAHEIVLRRRRDSIGSASVGLVVRGDDRATGSWDRLLVEQVIANLLDHADKYSTGKAIELSIVTDCAVTILTVCDQGAGVAAHDLGKVFDRFELHVARQIIEAHGGSIGVENAPDGDPSITVRLPRQLAGVGPGAEGTS